MPDLPETGRRYVENTARARLASPGVERFDRAPRGTAARLALTGLLLAALLAAALWLAR
jgi:hypothetical protein